MSLLFAYAFTLILQLPSFGGPVEIEFRFTDQEACERFRTTTERKIREDFSIDLRPGNPRGHRLVPDSGCYLH